MYRTWTVTACGEKTREKKKKKKKKKKKGENAEAKRKRQSKHYLNGQNLKFRELKW